MNKIVGDIVKEIDREKESILSKNKE